MAAGAVPRVRWRDEYHALPFGSLLGLVASIAIASAPLLIGYHIIVDGVWVARWGWILLGAMGIVFTLVPLFVARLLWEEVRAALRESNWCVRITDDALHVNLRSWRNWRLASSDPTVLRIPWAALAGVHAEHEEWRVLPRAGVRRRFKSYVTLELAAGVDVAAIDAAARAEIRRVLEHPDFPGGAGIWNDVPAFVDEAGRLRIYRVEMSLLRALARRLERGKRRSQVCTVGPEFAFQPDTVTPAQIAALVMRGEWGLAQMTAQFRMGMTYDESVAFIRRLFAAGHDRSLSQASPDAAARRETAVAAESASLLRKSWPIGLLAAGVGLFLILYSLGVIEARSASRRNAVFNDPGHWQIVAFGLVFVISGALFAIPERARALGRFVAMLFTVVMLTAGAGTIWYANGGSHRQKGGSMEAFLDSIAAWFRSFGLHPVLGAFIAGALIAFVFAYRRSPPDGATPSNRKGEA